jgi:hypothetical protein
MYDFSSDHLNTSCLKAKKRFFKILNIIVKKYKYQKQYPSSSCIQGTLHEHVFNTVALSKSECIINNFSIGEQKKLDIRHLLFENDTNIPGFMYKYKIPKYITGTVDFVYRDYISKKIYPIELKTIYDLSFDSPNFIPKLYIKLNHYVTQLCMYQKMWDTNVIFLLIVCRKTFQFTILPMDTLHYFDIIKSKFNKWVTEYIKFYI